MNLIRSTASAAAVLLLLGGAASAQDLNNWCREEVMAMCRGPGMSLADCMETFDLWPAVPNECVGDLQTMIEMDTEFEQQQGRDAGMFGYSYGGILRAGPGIQYRKLASLENSDWLEIMEDTGIWFDGYKWFLVETPLGYGYHWGGIFCMEGSSFVEGVFGRCN